MRKKVWI